MIQPRITSQSASVLVAAFAICGAGCRDQSNVLAVVLAMKGGVTQIQPAADNVTVGATLPSPATIRTAPNGAAVISAVPGVMFRLEPESEIIIGRLVLQKRVDEMISRTAQLKLRRGRALIWVDEFREGTVDVELQTRGGTVQVRGPAFAEVTIGPGGETRVICAGGSLQAAGTTLSAGEWATMNPVGNRPTAQVAADTDEVWRALLAAREIEPQLLDLEARQRERTPVRGLDFTGSVPKN